MVITTSEASMVNHLCSLLGDGVPVRMLSLAPNSGVANRPGAQSETLVISLPQQQVGLAVPGQSGGALFVTVTSHPQVGSIQR